ncbi:MBL fold metallo-hydrolase [Pseudonocardia asaccharolytica]|uniref:MBL fold metallo-hydrolase n=1 Tax=Pseudonocardia asaccharolytica DSM 44247 = NBRC 16224 TaxID=1123024 RepID=A0A511D756_9PSEU|nr:MBL fold metallo-hydrolase [Pseudonocardia asaccharolytica]GEL20641.1 MBL fold metallo-hydrolase [Pseudonocardia asaccharolytica DSM 44247 = NBRC 16224]
MSAHWCELAEGVLARRHTELDLTTGLVLGTERALVIDTRGDERQGAELAAAVRTVTTLPIVVAITHTHFDHCFGTAAFLPCPVHAHPGCVAALRATADAQRAAWVARYRLRDAGTAEALAATVPVVPDGSVDPAAVVDLGGRSVELRHLGRGHTDHDIVAHVRDAGVVFAGDLAEQGAPPDFGDAFPQDWPATLTALLGLGPRIVVPGHGEPMTPAEVADQRDALGRIAALHAAVATGSLDAAEAQRRSPFPGVRWSS